MPIDRPICWTCPHWRRTTDEPFPRGAIEDEPDDADTWGQCHRNAPTVTMERDGSPRFVEDRKYSPAWPMTPSYDSCGEHPQFGNYLAGLEDA